MGLPNWGGRGRWSEAAKQSSTSSSGLCLLGGIVEKVSRQWMGRRKNDQLRDLQRSVNDWAALGRLNNSDVLDLYHESVEFVASSHFGWLLIMSKCSEMARQPSHSVDLNAAPICQERGGRDLLASALKTLPTTSLYFSKPTLPSCHMYDCCSVIY